MEAHGREEFESYLPRSAFGWMVAGNELVGGIGEGGLEIYERRTHEHRESVRKLLG